MTGTINIGDKQVEMAANAASPFVYRNIFHEDFLLKSQEEKPDFEIFQKLAFVMSKQAETSSFADLMKLKVDDYYEWLIQFEALDLLNAAPAISDLYMGQTKKLSVPKRKGV